MKNRVKILILAVVGCFLAAGCNDKKGKEPVRSSGAAEQAAVVEEEPVWEGEYECERGDGECRDFIEFRNQPELRDSEDGGNGFYFSGTVFNTIVNSDVTVRDAPSAKSGKVLFAAKKGTKVQVLGISKDGWTFLSIREAVPQRGWAYGQYIDFKDEQDFRGVKTVEMKITDFKFTVDDSTTADLTATYEVNNTQKTLNLSAFRVKGQNFVTFFYDTYVDGSHYAVMPGLYTWEFARKQLRHTAFLTREPYLTSNGDLLLWNSVKFTDDKKTFIVGERNGRMAFRTSDRKMMFDERYYEGCDHLISFDFKNNTLTAACPADSTMAQNYSDIEEMDSAISEFREEYMRDNPDAGSDGPENTVEILCEMNLETGIRKITSGRWMYCQ